MPDPESSFTIIKEVPTTNSAVIALNKSSVLIYTPEASPDGSDSLLNAGKRMQYLTTFVDMSRLEKSPLLANGYNHPPHLGHMQFMQLPHPAAAHSALLSPGMPHNLARHDGQGMKGQTMPAIEAIARSGIWENCRAAYEDIVKHLERLREERCDPSDRPLPLDQKARDLSPRNGSPTDHSPVLNLSKSGNESAGSLGDADGDGENSGSEADGPDIPPSPRSPRSAVEDEDDNISEPGDDDEDDKDHHEMMEEGDLPMPAAPGSDCHQQTALNYSSLTALAGHPAEQATVSSTETLLRNIQGLLKVAADNARQQERQVTYEKAELKMDVLREREVKDNLERQLLSEQKMRVTTQKRLRREKRLRRRYQEQLEVEIRKRAQIEDALKAAGGAEQLKLINDRFLQTSQKQNNQKPSSSNAAQSVPSEQGDKTTEKQERDRESVESNSTSTFAGAGGVKEPSGVHQSPVENKHWNRYSNVDLINSGSLFWQNYSESLAQELEMERSMHQQQVDREVKSPFQDRHYYKNSVLFTSSAT